MANVHVVNRIDGHLHQGDIFKNIECIEYADINNGQVDISKVHYQYAVLLSQECDLTQDYSERERENEYKRRISCGEDAREIKVTYDKLLQSVMVAPLFNFEHFKRGSHFSNFGFEMSKSFSQYANPEKSPFKTLAANNNPRFHYLEFEEIVPIVTSVVDFKHFFTVSISWLYDHHDELYVCSLNELFRERLSQRFANYLSRIGLPNER